LNLSLQAKRFRPVRRTSRLVPHEPSAIARQGCFRRVLARAPWVIPGIARLWAEYRSFAMSAIPSFAVPGGGSRNGTDRGRQAFRACLARPEAGWGPLLCLPPCLRGGTVGVFSGTRLYAWGCCAVFCSRMAGAGAVAWAAAVALVGTGTAAAVVPPVGVIATVPVGQFPSEVAVNPSTHTAYVTNTDDDTVSVIDEATSTVTASPRSSVRAPATCCPWKPVLSTPLCIASKRRAGSTPSGTSLKTINAPSTTP